MKINYQMGKLWCFLLFMTW